MVWYAYLPFKCFLKGRDLRHKSEDASPDVGKLKVDLPLFYAVLLGPWSYLC